MEPDHRRPSLSRSFSDVTVYHDVEIVPENNDELESGCRFDAGQSSSGCNDQSSTPGESSTSMTDNIDSTSNPAVDPGISRHNSSFGKLVARIFDEKIPVKKKLKWFRRMAVVKDDGTIQFEVPGDVKPQALNFGNGVVYDSTNDEDIVDATGILDVPPLQIVMLIVGTRGDVQPFVAIGKRLQEYGHRVRLATHANFRDFVLTAGLEFFPLGGDPKVLAGYMVKNKGFLPSGPSEIPVQRNQIKEIIFSLLPACKDPDPDTNIPFKVDAIIANPPAYGLT